MRDDRFKTQPFDCMLYFYQAVQEPRIRCLIRFEGRLDGEALRRAVDLSLGAAPLLGSTFDEARCRWTEPRFSARDMLFIVEEPEDALQCLLSTIDCAREPQLKLFLVRGARFDALAAIVNHQVCDGAGFKEYLYLLADLYAKCAQGENPAKFAPGPRNLNQLLRNLSFRRKLSILRSPEDAPKPDPAMVLSLEGGEKPAIVAATIEAESLEALRRYAREHGAQEAALFPALRLNIPGPLHADRQPVRLRGRPEKGGGVPPADRSGACGRGPSHILREYACAARENMIGFHEVRTD